MACKAYLLVIAPAAVTAAATLSEPSKLPGLSGPKDMPPRRASTLLFCSAGEDAARASDTMASIEEGTIDWELVWAFSWNEGGVEAGCRFDEFDEFDHDFRGRPHTVEPGDEKS